jgi:DNA-binding CsgD family transcriptional regulator
VIGRAEKADLRLAGGLVSRLHAKILLADDELSIEDLGSRNGVLVNERKITERTPLAHGDVIAIGVESVMVVDEHVVRHPAHLSTLPPPAVVPPGDADVDTPNQDTVVATLEALTEREREVLELVVLGHTQREIAEKLHISVKTIETYRARISEKLGCRTRAELVSYAISAGLMGGILRPRAEP